MRLLLFSAWMVCSTARADFSVPTPMIGRDWLEGCASELARSRNQLEERLPGFAFAQVYVARGIMGARATHPTDRVGLVLDGAWGRFDVRIERSIDAADESTTWLGWSGDRAAYLWRHRSHTEARIDMSSIAGAGPLFLETLRRTIDRCLSIAPL